MTARNTLLRSLLICFAACASVVTSHSQTSLDLVDQLPPFLLSAQLLNNGHFSITTNYTGTSKTLIYREDGTGNRPVNYTSHIHVKVDDIVYQLPFEVNRTTDLPPPPNPMKLLRMYRDTVLNRPRINAQLLALADNSDSIRVTFTMEPVQRPSGAFIRMSVALENAGFVQHNVGVLMLVDTKIGTNDRAPIGTAFGYSGVETEYRKSVAPGLPEFWIAIEGTPLAPGLTARGNLRASELIEPDRFIFGNWVDDNGAGILGLYKVLWDERVPSGLSFTDSAILLLWEQRQLAARSRRTHAATEIGLVDSLVVSYGTGSGGGGGGGGGGSIGVAGPGSCLSVATAKEDTCGKIGYKPYSPDTVTGLYLVTNTGKSALSGMSLVFGAMPAGTQALLPVVPVIASNLNPNETGITILPVVLRPRLNPTTYAVPIAFVDNTPDTILRDTVCITVPGILASIDGKNTVTLPVCPGNKDTFQIPVELKGIRCLPVAQATVINPPSAPARIVGTMPMLPADGVGYVQIEASPTIEDTTIVQVRVVVRDWESLTNGDTTWVDLVDTVDVTIIGKHAEVQALVAGDTLVLPMICVRDTAIDSMQVQNVGGCDATLATVTLSNNAGGVFSIHPLTTIPQTIARGARGQVYIRANSAVPGTFVGELEITSVAKPGTMHVPVRIVIDKPGYTLSADTMYLDTVCPDVTTTKFFNLLNVTGCDVRIDSIRQTGIDTISISPPNEFFIGSQSQVSLGVSLAPSFEGPFQTSFRVYSAEGGNRDVVVVGFSASRTINTPTNINLGRNRVGQSTYTVGNELNITNTGTQPITINSIQFSGQHATEFSAGPLSITLPYTLNRGQTVAIELAATPKAIGIRTAIATIVCAEDLCAVVEPIRLEMYGVQPLLDIERHDVQQGAICIGSNTDTTLVMRNLGNEVLHITNITCSGALQPAIPQPLPITLDSGAAIQLPVQTRTDVIGQQTCECTFATDADWFTTQDTTVRIGLTGVVCGTLWADTVNGYVGTITPTTIKLEPDERTQLTRSELMQAINDYGSTTQVRVTADSTVVRFSNAVNGSLQGALVSVTPTSVTAQTQGIPNTTSNILAGFDADVLLGMSNRTALRVTVDSMAGGLHALRVHDGLLRSEYCAFDQRRVTVSAASIIGAREQGGSVVISAFQSTDVVVDWYNLLGEKVGDKQLLLTVGTVTTLPMPSTGDAILYASVRVVGSNQSQTVAVVR